MPVIGHLVANKSGHLLNHMLVSKVLADPSCYEIVDLGKQDERERLDVLVPAFGKLEVA
jgi:UDP-3-O-[3-hydroxymyristoyl] N-acetylglucosamine deacetylase